MAGCLSGGICFAASAQDQLGWQCIFQCSSQPSCHPAGSATPREPQTAAAPARETTPAVDLTEPKSAVGSARKRPRGKSMPPTGPVEVRQECTNHAGGDVRVQLAVELPEPPEGNTVQCAHNLDSLKGKPFLLRRALLKIAASSGNMPF